MPRTPMGLIGCVPSGATFEFDTRFNNLAMPDCPADSASAVTSAYAATALAPLAHVVTTDRTVDVCMSKVGFAGSSAAALVACDGSTDCSCSEVDDDEFDFGLVCQPCSDQYGGDGGSKVNAKAKSKDAKAAATNAETGRRQLGRRLGQVEPLWQRRLPWRPSLRAIERVS